MPEITVSQDVYNQLLAFKQVIEAVIEDKLDVNTCAELVLDQGLNAMLAELIGPLDTSTLITSFQQLAAKSPAEVYSFVTETIKRGAAVQQQEEMKRRLGF